MSTTADVGYCEPEDVRQVLQEVDLSGPLASEFVTAHIRGESEWVQETTNRHWYDPDAATDAVVGTSPLTHAEDEQDIKAGPHAGPSQLFRADRAGAAEPQYPVVHGGRYTRVQLHRRDVSTLTELLIRQRDGSYVDWVTDPEYEQGRGEDYYLQVDDSEGTSHIYLHVGSLPQLADYGAAVVASYDYGIPEIPQTVRQAVASYAGAALLREDEQAVAVPDDGQLVSLDTKADELENRADRLMRIHQ